MWRLVARQPSETRHSTVGSTVLQVTSPESESPISASFSLSYRLKEFVVDWFRILWSRLSRGLLARVRNGILLALVPGIALLRLVIWLFTPRRDKEENERDYSAFYSRSSPADKCVV